VRGQVDVIVAVIAALEEQLELVESELRRYARADRRCRALETIFRRRPRSSPATCSPRSAMPAASRVWGKEIRFGLGGRAGDRGRAGSDCTWC
jgi:hypothetical protein